jgi:CO/xanthine dehydrogenase FAD-binding subunit
MKLWSHYHLARSVQEALDLLAQYQGRAQLVAGGTDLLLDIQQGNHPPLEALIDITRVSELTTIERQGDALLVGAAATHSAIEADPALRHHATCLVEGCGLIGGPQVRNVATLGGNVAHAMPAADGTLALVTLRAEAEVASVSGRRWLPITDLFVGPGQSRIDPSRELLTRFRFASTGANEGSAFKRIMRPQGVALPILGCAAWVRLDSDRRRFAELAVSLGPIGPVPGRAISIEAALIGQPADDAHIEAAALQAKREMKPRTSKYRATAEYRTEMIELLINNALKLAVTRAFTGEAVPIELS